MVSSTGRNLVPISAYVIASFLLASIFFCSSLNIKKKKEIFPTYTLTL